MSINIIFAIIAGAVLCGAIGLFYMEYKHADSLNNKPGLHASLHLGSIVFAAIGMAFMILSVLISNCPNCGAEIWKDP